MVNILPAKMVAGVVRKRGKQLLGPIDLELSPSGFTIVLGPNGAGKTTLLRALHGLERLSGGHLNWAIPTQQAANHQAFVFQTPIMLRRSVGENLAYPLTLQRVADAKSRALVSAKRIGLSDAFDRPATLLSGGERQKLALARALIREPQLLFLDEPCASLDGRSIREIEVILKEAQSMGTRILMATHDLGQARRLADDILFMMNGQIIEHALAIDFFNSPQTSQALALLNGEIVE